MRTPSMPRSVLMALALLAFAGCRREEVEDPHHHHEAHTVDLRLKLVFKYGSHDYELASEYMDATGRLYRLDTLRFLLSTVGVIDDDGSTLASYPGLQLLVDASHTNDFALGSLTAAHAHQITFTLGLPPALNDSDPAVAAPPLNEATMHWGMGAEEGYWFLVITGRMDSDNNGVLEPTDQSFTYKCGTDALARSGWAIMHVEIPDGGTLTVESAVDVERLLSGLDLMATPEALGAQPLNVQLMDSLRNNFNESH